VRATAADTTRCDVGVKDGLVVALGQGLAVGDRDIDAGTIGVKDLTTGAQVEVATDSVVAEVLSRLNS